jgi:hypothetical protein
MAHETLFGNHGGDVLDFAAVKKLWGEHQKGFRDRSTELWALFIFRLWQSKFLSVA